MKVCATEQGRFFNYVNCLHFSNEKFNIIQLCNLLLIWSKPVLNKAYKTTTKTKQNKKIDEVENLLRQLSHDTGHLV